MTAPDTFAGVAPSEVGPAPMESDVASDPEYPGGHNAPEGRASSPRGLALTLVGWVVVTVVGLAVVVYALGPLFEQRSQHKLLSSYLQTVKDSSLESTGLYGFSLPTAAPAIGSSVGLLGIPRLKVDDVVTEGVGPSQTESGPGHVPGTAGLGQSGNAALVGRRAAFGGVFSGLSSLRRGDEIAVTTIEGRSLYIVRQVKSLALTSGTPSSGSVLGASPASTALKAPATLGSSVNVDDLYGPSVDNRLTLVTSSSLTPWNTSHATVVVAIMKTVPFSATLQQGRSSDEEGRSGESGAVAPLVLALLAFGAVAFGAVYLYRRSPRRTAYLVTTAPLVLVTVLLAIAVTRSLPAWI